MYAKNTNQNTMTNRASSKTTERVEIVAQRTMPSAQTDARRNVSMRESELVSFTASSAVSRAAKIARVATLTDIDQLINIAVSDVPLFARKGALRRIDALLDGEPLAPSDLMRLTPCLGEKDLIVYAVLLMDIGNFDWCAHCNEDTVSALCIALHECENVHETVLLEDTFAHLIHTRPDLGKNLLACSPGKLHLKAMYDPLIVNNTVYIDLTKEDNVA